jgi:hypothetical protein
MQSFAKETSPLLSKLRVVTAAAIAVRMIGFFITVSFL